MAKKNKFYVVWKGRKTGVFSSWDECKNQVVGFEGAQYKGFPSKTEADFAAQKNYWQAVTASSRGNFTSINENSSSVKTPNLESLSVDAACSGNPGLLEYRGVYTRTGEEIFRQGPFECGTNNIGEFLALVHGLAILKQQGKTCPIYSDSVNAIGWVTKKRCRTKLEENDKNAILFELIERAEKWLAENVFSTQIIKWETKHWGEIPADFGRK